MLRPLLYCIVILNLVLCSSCNKEKLKAPTSSFLVVTNPAVNTTSSDQGDNNHKITDMWLYVDGNYQGAFEVGKIMPIVAEGNVNISLLAGIKNNGIAKTRQPYSFYKKIDFSLSLEAGKTYTYAPVFEYKDNLNFFYENFDSGIGFTYTSVGDTAATAVTPGANGSVGRALFMGMSTNKPLAKIVSNIGYAMPTAGSTVYLELDYKCNQQISVGVSGYSSSTGDGPERPIIVLNPTDTWNKIYIQLTEAVSTQPTYPYYKVYIKAYKSADVANPAIYLDNIKLIY